MKTVKAFLKYSKKYKKLILITLFFLSLEALIDGISPYILKKIIETCSGGSFERILKWLFVFLVVLLVGIFSSLFGSYFSAKASSKFCFDLRKSIFSRILKTHSLNSSHIDVAKGTTVLSNDVETVGTIFLYFLRMFLKIPFLFLLSFIFMFSMERSYFLVIVLCLPFLILILYILLKKAFPYFAYEQETLDKVVECVDENLKGKQLIQITGTEEKQRRRFEKKSSMLKNLNIKAMKTFTLSTPITMFVVYFLTVLVLFLSYENKNVNPNNIGTVMAFIQYLTLLLSSLLMGGMLLLLMAESLVSFKRILIYLNLEEEVITEKKKVNPDKMAINQVSFSYHEKGESILENITFQIKKGEKVAVVGKTGAGKSTLLKLMANLYEPTKGEILLNEENIKDCEVKNCILYSPQEMVLFKGTILDNISFYGEGPSKNILEVSDVSSILKRKSKGIKEEINAFGNNYSGGEKNRISLARALKRNPSFLLLDDSLSATDVKTEKRILKKIFRFKSNLGLVYVTSRLSHLELFDKVLVLKDGKVETIGSLEEVKRNPLFLEMFTLKEEVHDGK